MLQFLKKLKLHKLIFLVYRQDSEIEIKTVELADKIEIILFDSYGQYFFKNIILHNKHRRKTLIYYNNDKCLLVLVIYVFVMFYFFFLQKAENNRLKKGQLAKLCNIFFCFCLK